ncbi:MAG: hypothetical protein AB1714_10065 [Acidobacteriota bacterium]
MRTRGVLLRDGGVGPSRFCVHGAPLRHRHAFAECVASRVGVQGARIPLIACGSVVWLVFAPSVHSAGYVRIEQTEIRKIVEEGSGVVRDPDWSPRGDWIAYDGPRGIWIVRPDGSEKRIVLEDMDEQHIEMDPNTFVQATAGKAAFYWDPSFSHDGTHLAIRVKRKDGDTELPPAIGTASIDSPGDVELLTVGTQPAWSPDGSRIAFVDSGRIYTITPQATGQTELTRETANAANPMWTPDGRSIVFLNAEGAWIVPADGSGSPQLVFASKPVVSVHPPLQRFSNEPPSTSCRLLLRSAALSPQGDIIAINGIACDSRDVLAVGARNGTDLSVALEAVLTASRGFEDRVSPEIPPDGWNAPSWSPDGNEIVIAYTPPSQSGATCALGIVTLRKDALPGLLSGMPRGLPAAAAAVAVLVLGSLGGLMLKLRRGPKRTKAPARAVVPSEPARRTHRGPKPAAGKRAPSSARQPTPTERGPRIQFEEPEPRSSGPALVFEDKPAAPRKKAASREVMRSRPEEKRRPHTLILTSSSSWVRLGTDDDAPLKARVLDQLGDELEGCVVRFEADEGMLDTEQAATDRRGIARSVWRPAPATPPGGCKTRAWCLEAPIVESEMRIRVTPRSPVEIELEIDPEELPADGRSIAKITARALDERANPVAEVPISLRTDETGLPGKWANSAGLTDTEGRFRAEYTMPAQCESQQIAIIAEVKTQPPEQVRLERRRWIRVRQLVVELLPQSAKTSAGSQEPVRIRARLADSSGTPIAGEPLRAEIMPSEGGSVEPPMDITDDNGGLEFVYRPGMRAGSFSMTVRLDGRPDVAATAAIEQTGWYFDVQIEDHHEEIVIRVFKNEAAAGRMRDLDMPDFEGVQVLCADRSTPWTGTVGQECYQLAALVAMCGTEPDSAFYRQRAADLSGLAEHSARLAAAIRQNNEKADRYLAMAEGLRDFRDYYDFVTGLIRSVASPADRMVEVVDKAFDLGSTLVLGAGEAVRALADAARALSTIASKGPVTSRGLIEGALEGLKDALLGAEQAAQRVRPREQLLGLLHGILSKEAAVLDTIGRYAGDLAPIWAQLKSAGGPARQVAELLPLERGSWSSGLLEAQPRFLTLEAERLALWAELNRVSPPEELIAARAAIREAAEGRCEAYAVASRVRDEARGIAELARWHLGRPQ